MGRTPKGGAGGASQERLLGEQARDEHLLHVTEKLTKVRLVENDGIVTLEELQWQLLLQLGELWQQLAQLVVARPNGVKASRELSEGVILFPDLGEIDRAARTEHDLLDEDRTVACVVGGRPNFVLPLLGRSRERGMGAGRARKLDAHREWTTFGISERRREARAGEIDHVVSSRSL